MRYIVMDLSRSTSIHNAADYLTEPVEAPSNYTKPEAIAAYVAKAKQAQLDKAALDIDLARIVCLGWLSEGSVIETHLAKDETQERTLLGKFSDIYFPNVEEWYLLAGVERDGYFQWDGFRCADASPLAQPLSRCEGTQTSNGSL